MESRPDVVAMITKGEGNSIEFKSSARWDYHAGAINKALESVIVKAVGGLLNSKGGTLLIDVDDKRCAIGLKKDYGTLTNRPNRDGYEQLLMNILSRSFGRDVAASLSISFHEVGGEDVCALQIPKSSSPVYVTDGGRSKLFVRTGNITQELNTKESVEYVKRHW